MSDSLAETAVALSASPEVAILAKATLMLVAVLFGVRFARTARAAVRHLLVVASFMMLLLLPAALVVTTPVVIEVSGVAPVVTEPARSMTDVEIRGPVSSGVPQAGPVADQPTASASAPFSPFSPARLLRGVWAFGAMVFLVPVALALWRVARIRRRAVRWCDGEALVRRLGAHVGVSRPVAVLRHEAVEAPMTCGVVRPAIFLPWDVESWSASDLRHALIHELEHVRRGDWPAHIMARVVCAVYWFHPLVWVAWRRLHLEAERACDDAVVRRSESRAYATQLVQLAKRLSASHPRPLLPMAGRGHLGTRIDAVLDGRVPRGRAGTAWVVGTMLMAVAAAAVIAPVKVVAARPVGTPLAQSSTRTGDGQADGERPVLAVAGSQDIGARSEPGPDGGPTLLAPSSTRAGDGPGDGERPVPSVTGPQDVRPEPVPADGLTFEVASIRLNPDPNVNMLISQVRAFQHRVFTTSTTTVRELIRYAYDYQFRPVSHIVGGPDWLDTERYVLIAQAAAPFPPPPGRGMLPREASAMLRAMLAERMQLKVRFEMREREVYALVLDRPDGRLGPNLTPAKGECQPSMATPDPAIPLPPCPFLLGPTGNGSLYEMKGITMPELASTFGNFPVIDELVIDNTGLTGRYDMSVRFQPEMILSPFAPPVPGPVEVSEFPPIRVAIRQQLGLRLVRTRAPVDVIVIEHVERPSEN